MNINYSSQHQGVVAWTTIAAASPEIDIRHHVGFSFTFKVDTDIAADAIFEVTAAPADVADPCIAGAFHPVEETLICMQQTGAVPGPKSEITIPAGTLKGTVCTATLPCKPDAFIKVMPVSGDTGKIEVVVTLSGPR